MSQIQERLIAESPMRDVLLANLKSRGRHPYRRYMGLPLRYAGGKSLAVGYVVSYLPDGLERLVSPFFGGGSVEIAVAKELGIPVLGFDVFEILANYWRVQIESPELLADRIGKWRPTEATYRKVKERLRRHWKEEHLIADSSELAAHYWFNHNLSYGPGFLGWMSKIYQEEPRFQRLLAKVREFRAGNLTVAAGDFAEVLPRYRDDFLYCDPPYYLAGDSKMFRGIYPMRNFPVHHNGFDHAKLAALLQAHRGGFILSYNDCSAVREWYADCEIVEVAWQYTLGQGETRIGKNRIDNGTLDNVKASHELLIVRH